MHMSPLHPVLLAPILPSPVKPGGQVQSKERNVFMHVAPWTQGARHVRPGAQGKLHSSMSACRGQWMESGT